MWVDNISCSGGTTYHLSPKWLAEASDRGAWRSSLHWATKFPCRFSWSHLCRVPDVSVARNNKKWVVQLIFCLDFVPSCFWNKKLKGSLEMWKCILYPKFFGFFLTVKDSYVCTCSSELNGFASVTEHSDFEGVLPLWNTMAVLLFCESTYEFSFKALFICTVWTWYSLGISAWSVPVADLVNTECFQLNVVGSHTWGIRRFFWDLPVLRQ